MRKKQSKKSAWILALLMLGALALTFHLGAVSALAAACGSGATLDTDCDGFIDSLEINNPSWSLPPGMSLAANNSTTIPKCGPNPTPAQRAICFDPNTQDLFVIINRATTGSNIPLPPYDGSYFGNIYQINPLALVYPGLGVATHELLQPGGTSQLIPGTGGWYAVRIVEDLTVSGSSTYWGFAKFGVPYNASKATVWSQKIINWINNQCNSQCFDLDNDPQHIAEACYTPSQAASFWCKNANSGTSVNMTVNPDLRKLNSEFIQYVASHETSHMINLAAGSKPSGTTTADHHYTILKGVLMEQFPGVTVTKDNSTPPNITVSIYLSNQYTPQDATQHKLK
jgi:hypothetical protein